MTSSDVPIPGPGSGERHYRPTRRQIKTDQSGSHDFQRFHRQF